MFSCGKVLATESNWKNLGVAGGRELFILAIQSQKMARYGQHWLIGNPNTNWEVYSWTNIEALQQIIS